MTDVYYGVFLKGGSIGEASNRMRQGANPIKTFGDKALAQQDARRRNRTLSPGEKNYYGLRYFVKNIREEIA